MESKRAQLQRLARHSRLLREESLREAGISSTVISQAVSPSGHHPSLRAAVSSDRDPAAPCRLDSPQTERCHPENRLSSARSRPQQNGRFLFGGRSHPYPQ